MLVLDLLAVVLLSSGIIRCYTRCMSRQGLGVSCLVLVLVAAYQAPNLQKEPSATASCARTRSFPPLQSICLPVLNFENAIKSEWIERPNARGGCQ